MFGLPTESCVNAHNVVARRSLIEDQLSELDAEERAIDRLAAATDTIVSFDPPYYISGGRSFNTQAARIHPSDA